MYLLIFTLDILLALQTLIKCQKADICARKLWQGSVAGSQGATGRPFS